MIKFQKIKSCHTFFDMMKDESFEFIKGHGNKVSVVGFGSYGEVKLAKNTETGEVVAIKMIHGKNAKQEIDVHHKLNHPNIIHLLNYYYDEDKNMTYMVLEFAQGGTLNEKIKFGYGHLPKEKIKSYFRDICRAVNYLHELRYMHRDIKPQNILLTKDDHAKLCDFGFAAILEYRNTRCGTYEYMAPEMIQEKPYDYKVDIWALGILLFELIQGVAPFRGENGQDVIGQMKKQIVFSNRFQKDEIELIRMILRVNAEKRPKVSEILQHSFFDGLDDSPNQKKSAKQTSEQQPKNTKKFNLQMNTHFSRTGSSSSNLPEMKQQEKVEEKKKIQNKQKEFKPFIPQAKHNFRQTKANYTSALSSPNSVSSSQFQNISSGPISSSNSLNTQNLMNNTATNIGSTNPSSLSGINSMYKSPTNQGTKSNFPYQIPKSGISNVLSPSSQARTNIQSPQTTLGGYSGSQSNYSQYSNNSTNINPPTSNFWRKPN